MPKTGSTSIQKAFDGYEDSHLVYARLSSTNHGGPLIACFTQQPKKTHMFRHRSAKRTEKLIKEKKREVEASLRTDKSVIYSGERIIRNLSNKEVANMMSFFRERFDRVEVIVYVRPLASLVSSQVQQLVKMGKHSFQLPAPHYKRSISPILDNVDRENIQIVRFDRKDLIGGDIVQDFAHRVGAERVPETAADANLSLSAEAVGAMFVFNKYSGHLLPPRVHARTLKAMTKALDGVGKTKFGLSAGLVEAHLKTHADEIAWMEDKAGFDVKGEVKTVPEPIETEEDLHRMAKRIVALKENKSPVQPSPE